jgi:N-acetylglucosaminyl-diphospho-decaprenol L-rhamnosyltransferase
VAVDVSILIVTYKCRDAARDCLESIYEQTSGIDYEVIVVENDSGDGTAEMVRTEFPQARLIEMDENVGFAAGVNLAAGEAEGEYLLLLNPDTMVHEGAVRNLVGFARRHPEHGLYGGRTLHPDGTVDPGSCWDQQTVWSLVCFATMLTSAFPDSRLFDPESIGGWQRDTVREVGMVTGCLCLAPRHVWEELGGFDLRFWMYGEDADLSMRAIRAGYRPAITPDAVITHEVGVSSGTQVNKLTMILKGKATLLHKHWGSPRRQVGLTLLLLGAGSRALVARLAGRRAGARLDAWRDVWRGRASWLAGYPEAEPQTRALEAAAR